MMVGRFSKKRGIILVEAIIAMAVIVVVMTALITALVSAVNTTRFSEDQTIATGYAQEGMEIIRNQKNSNFGNFSGLIGGSSRTFCLGADDTSVPGSCGLLDSKFQREIYVNTAGRNRDNEQTCEQNIDPITSEIIDSFYIASVVSWNSSRCDGGGRCHEVVLESCLTNLSYFEETP